MDLEEYNNQEQCTTNTIVVEKNKLQLELIILFFGLSLPYLKKIPKYLFNIKCDLAEIKTMQYTNINIALGFLYYGLRIFGINNFLLRDFITINSNSILVIYHSFYIYDYKLFYYFPKSNNMSIFTFHFCSSLVHILPTILFTTETLLCEYNYEHINISLYTILFKFIWTFQTFGSFDVSKAYFDIPIKYVYILWYFAFIIDILSQLVHTMLKDNINIIYILY